MSFNTLDRQAILESDPDFAAFAKSPFDFARLPVGEDYFLVQKHLDVNFLIEKILHNNRVVVHHPIDDPFFCLVLEEANEFFGGHNDFDLPVKSDSALFLIILNVILVPDDLGSFNTIHLLFKSHNGKDLVIFPRRIYCLFSIIDR